MFTTITISYLFISLIILGLGHYYIPKIDVYVKKLTNAKPKNVKPKARLFSFLPKNKKPPSPIYLKFIKYGYYTSLISALLLFINYEPVSIETLKNIKTIEDLKNADPFTNAHSFLMIVMIINFFINIFSLFTVLFKFLEFTFIIALFKSFRFLWGKLKILIKYLFNILGNKPTLKRIA